MTEPKYTPNLREGVCSCSFDSWHGSAGEKKKETDTSVTQQFATAKDDNSNGNKRDPLPKLVPLRRSGSESSINSSGNDSEFLPELMTRRRGETSSDKESVKVYGWNRMTPEYRTGTCSLPKEVYTQDLDIQENRIPSEK